MKGFNNVKKNIVQNVHLNMLFVLENQQITDNDLNVLNVKKHLSGNENIINVIKSSTGLNFGLLKGIL